MKSIIRFLLSGWCLLSILVTQAQPSIGDFNVYYGHLHNHSNVSDGINTPDEAYNYAKTIGKLDFFSLADHSNLMDANEWTSIKTAANKYNVDSVFTAFYGFEWTDNYLGHVTVINSDNIISIQAPTNTFEGFSNWLNSNECVAFFNHPGRNNPTGREFEHFTTTPTDKIVGMELWNKTDGFPVYYYTDGYYANDGNKSWYDEAISRGWKVGASGSEDNHSGTWGTATTSKLAVLANANNRTEIYNALKSKRFFTTYDLNLALSFKIGGNEMGSTILSPVTSFTIQASDADGELFTQVQLLKNGIVIQSWQPNTSLVSISENLTFADGEYYYIRVKQSDNDEAISSPIWIGAVNQSPSSNITSPYQYSNFVAPASITITAAASDPDGNIQKVEFYSGATLLGESNTSPYSFTWNGVSVGSYSLTAKAVDNLGAASVSSAIQISVTNPGDPLTISSMIATGLDDVEESITGNISNNVNSTDIELVNDAGTSAGNQVVGLRFINLNIPQGALINSAYIQFTCDEITTGTCNLIVTGEDVDNSAAFTTTNFNVSGRTKTTAQVSWIPVEWTTAEESGINQQTPNISAIIQEIVSRSGFLSTGAISLIITGTGSRVTDSYEGAPTQAAKLVVQYTIVQNNQPPVVSITNPSPGANFTAPASITITADASDSDGSIQEVKFYQGTTLLSSDSSYPYSYTWTGVNEGDYLLKAVATDNLGSTANSAEVSVIINAAPVPEVFTKRILSGSDDVEETAKGSVVLSGDDIELVYDSKTTGSQVVGLRFNGITIPKGSTVTKAYIQFTVDEKTNNGCNLTIKGENSDNATSFSTASKNVSTRIRTIAFVNWIPSGWTTVRLAGTAQQTPDLKLIVQEIVNRPGWSSGNSMAYVITGTGSGKRTAFSYETSSVKAALLYIEYQPAPAAPTLRSARTGSDTPEIKKENALSPSEIGLKCYPVPFTDVLNIDLHTAENDEITSIQVFNSLGARQKYLDGSGTKMQLQLNDLSTGIYFIRVRTSTEMFQYKIIKK